MPTPEFRNHGNGQGPNRKPLSVYCADDSIDIIILSFVHLFPRQANGYPGIDFGNQCYAERLPGPGYQGKATPSNNRLLKCPNLQRDLYTCRQTSTKKILLSLGGRTGSYQLTGASDGSSFATQLWCMFGPRQNAWVQRSFPRPFDYNDIGFSVDGFDLDVEHPSTDASAGYKALVTKLRSLYATVPGTFYLTASPQCIVPDANMKDMLTATTFDMIFIQFYNYLARVADQGCSLLAFSWAVFLPECCVFGAAPVEEWGPWKRLWGPRAARRCVVVIMAGAGRPESTAVPGAKRDW
ncbi:carbohydrate-binding module family 18 protein [Apiospora aurea]|uniref:chitinase n=1 Tax=Apiospora aurea TaxID=335848 RepID=A0ABR1QXH6_9PEZI